MISINSANFGFLKADNPQLVRLGALAEHYCQDDPNTCLIELRQFGKLPAQTTAAQAGLSTSPDGPQADLIRKLKLDRILPVKPPISFIRSASQATARLITLVAPMSRRSHR
jgi:hypothetical protein